MKFSASVLSEKLRTLFIPGRKLRFAKLPTVAMQRISSVRFLLAKKVFTRFILK